MSDFKAKTNKKRFRLGLHPKPRRGAYSAPQTPSWIYRALLLRDGRRKEKKKGERREKGRVCSWVAQLLHALYAHSEISTLCLKKPPQLFFRIPQSNIYLHESWILDKYFYYLLLSSTFDNTATNTQYTVTALSAYNLTLHSSSLRQPQYPDLNPLNYKICAEMKQPVYIPHKSLYRERTDIMDGRHDLCYTLWITQQMSDANVSERAFMSKDNFLSVLTELQFIRMYILVTVTSKLMLLY